MLNNINMELAQRLNLVLYVTTYIKTIYKTRIKSFFPLSQNICTGCIRKYVHILLAYNFNMGSSIVNSIAWPETTHM